jgi:M6 family metalloprotease-like protein
MLMLQVPGVRAPSVAALASLAVWLWPGANAVAVPACPEPVTVEQPDGRQIKIHLRGDEFVHWHEDEAGFTILKDARRGRWIYARPDRQGNLEATDLLVGRDDPTKPGVARHLVPRNTGTRARVPGAGQVSAAGTQDAPLLAPRTGIMKNLVLLVQFPDLIGTRTKAEFDALFNTLGYTTDGAAGSVRDYYREVSHNTLDVVSVITDWITVTNSYAYYGANDASGNDLHPREMVQEALTKLEANGFDFSTLDADGDGWVDGLTVIHAGGGEEYSGNNANYIWSHKWSMLTTLTFDGKSMRDYHTEPERRGWDSSPSTQGITRIGVICHETGHFLGLPDLYDTDYNSEGVGNFCLMAGGSWNGNYGTSPAHMSAWCKKSLNWITPTLVTAAGTYTAPRVEDSMTVFRLSGAFPSTQYFLVENRQGYGFDAALPGSTRGLLIWHVDETQSSNNDQTHYLVDLEEASGTQHLELNLNGGDDADYYRQGNNTSFTASSTPNNLSYAGTPLNLNISSVSAAGATMTFTIAPLPIDHFDWEPIASPQSAGSPFAVTVTARDSFGGAAAGFTGTANLSGRAEDLVTAGSGTSAWAYPLATATRVDRTQVIYLASEVGGARTLTALELYVTTVPGQMLNNWTIRMKHTSLSGYPAAPAWEGSGWTTVYQSNQSVAATGWVRFTFTTPFAFNGTEHLMVDYSFNNSSTAADGQCRFTAVGSNRSIYYGTTGRYGDPLTWSGTTSPKPNASVNVPNIRLASQSAVTISPATSGSFVNGVWTGNMTVLQAAPSMLLLASDGAGHAGASASFTVTVNAVNHAPSFVGGPNLQVAQNAGAQSFANWATAISAGPPDESGQVLSFSVTGDKTYLFSTQPFVSPTGTLTFTPNGNYRGTVNLTLTLHDNGGTANGGQDASPGYPFTITVGLDADGNRNGLPDDWETTYFAAPGVLPGDDSDGDGFTNAEEFEAGTNPANPADAPGITAIQASGTDVIVSFRTWPGKSYRVDRGDQPVGGTWLQVGTTVPGTGEVLSVTDLGRVTDQKCFYRVVVLP